MQGSTQQAGTHAKLSLTEDQFRTLQLRFSNADSPRAGQPYLIIMLCGQAEWPDHDVTKFLGISQETVAAACDAWLNNGINGIDNLARGGRG